MLRRKQVQTRAAFRRRRPVMHPRFRCRRPLLLTPLDPYRRSLRLHHLALILAPFVVLERGQEVKILGRDRF